MINIIKINIRLYFKIFENFYNKILVELKIQMS